MVESGQHLDYGKNYALENNLFKAGLFISLICYFLLGYNTERTESIQLFAAYFVLFSFYLFVVFTPHLADKNFKLLVTASFLFRVLFLAAVPALSDDYFRFIWDGRLIEEGINPFLYIPDEVQKQALLPGESNQVLYAKMNSPHYYTVYPPILQFVFFVAAKLSFSNNYAAILILRIFILAAEVGSYFFIKKILAHLKLPKNGILIYFLNPLVILEINGNLHCEGLMLFFVLASFYFLFVNKFIISSLFFSLAVSTKMIPLVLLPLLIKKIGFKKGFLYAMLVAVSCFVLFLPFVNQELLNNLGNSIGLYFQKFEFNASIYYLLRWIGFQLSGYNEIAIIGKQLPFVCFVLIVLISLRYKPNQSYELFFEKALTILFVYYLFSLIIHPWYITFLVLISVFLKQRFAIIWSLLIFGTYLAYAFLPFKENVWLLCIEYGLVVIWYFLERNKLKFA
jgi:alpha-1,6-mannosyltransferase